MKIIKIYTDGGARGNPGPAAAAFVVVESGKIVHKDSTYLGERTNNEAEYEALLIALKWLNKNKESVAESKIRFLLDSELMVRQLNGDYKVKSKNLKPLFTKALALTQKLDNEKEFMFIRREKNKLADSLVNLKIDEIFNKK
jgi:ribonuclease HI